MAERGGPKDSYDAGHIDSRVSRVEATLDTVQAAVERVEREGQEGRERLEAKLDDQTAVLTRKLDQLSVGQANAGRTNWSVIFGGAGVVIAVIGALGAAWVGPLSVRDAELSRRADGIELRAAEDRVVLMRTFEMSVRLDERGKR